MPEGRRDWGWLTLTLVASDLGAVLLAFWLAAALVWRTGVGINGGNDSDWLVLVMLPVLGVIFFAQGLYEPANLLVGAREFAGVFRASSYGLLAITVITFVLRWPLSRSWTVASWALMTGLVIAFRFGIRRVAAALRRRGRLTERAVIVGADEDSIALAEQVNQPGSGMRVVGILDDYIPTGTELPGGLRVVGPSSSLMETTSRLQVHDAIIAPQALPWETLRELILVSATRANGLQVHLSAGFYDMLTAGVRFSERSHVPLLTLRKARLSPVERAVKAVLDRGLATVLLLGLSPALLLMVAWQRRHAGPSLLDRRRVLGGTATKGIEYTLSGATGQVIIPTGSWSTTITTIHDTRRSTTSTSPMPKTSSSNSSFRSAEERPAERFVARRRRRRWWTMASCTSTTPGAG